MMRKGAINTYQPEEGMMGVSAEGVMGQYEEREMCYDEEGIVGTHWGRSDVIYIKR
jgi:hypothetical protein